MVIAWLLNSLSKEISESVIYCLTAVDLWNELQERYGQHEAASHPGWQLAMQQELDALASNSTWDVVPLPPGMKSLPCGKNDNHSLPS